MSKYEFLNKMLDMYYINLNFAKEQFQNERHYYDDLVSDEMVKSFMDNVAIFLKNDYKSIELEGYLISKIILFRNALDQDNPDLFYDNLYSLCTDFVQEYTFS